MLLIYIWIALLGGFPGMRGLFNQEMNRLRAVGIPVVAISGNHDAASVITKSLSPPENVTFLPTKKPGSYLHPSLPLAVHGQGFATAAVQENLVLDYPSANAARFNIGLLHTSLAGNPEHDTYAPCSLRDLDQKGYQYWALGHIHQPTVLQEFPHVVYAGNPQGRHVRETGERGCYLVEVDDDLKVSTHTFHVLDVLRWAHLELDVSELESPDALRETIAGLLNEAVIDRLLALRLTLTGATSLHGTLYAELGRWQAECVNLAQEVDPDQLWFERLRLRTSPTYDPADLAEQDDLTAQVLQALENFDPKEKPATVATLEGKLPQQALERLGDDPVSVDDVSALVLHAIATSQTS